MVGGPPALSRLWFSRLQIEGMGWDLQMVLRSCGQSEHRGPGHLWPLPPELQGTGCPEIRPRVGNRCLVQERVLVYVALWVCKS